MRNRLSAFALTIASAAYGQLLDPGFEQPSNGPWRFTCSDVGAFEGSTAPNGGTYGVRMPMLTGDSPDCYHMGGTLPMVYQEMPGVQNGDQVTLSFWRRCEPDPPEMIGAMHTIVIFGWWDPPYVREATGPSAFAYYNASVAWEAQTISYMVSGLPAGRTFAVFLGGHATLFLNGTLYFDNAQATVNNSGLALSTQLWLDGAYVQGQNLMRDDLRTQGLLPLTEPYTALFGGSGDETVAPSVLAVTGNNAIVDWVRVELRSAPTGPVVAQRNALLQRDGDVVHTDGISPVPFPLPAGPYYVTVRHRNHLAVMSAAPFTLGGTPTVVDFRAAATNCYTRAAPNADLPRRSLGTQRLLWSGNALVDERIRYIGANNDRDLMLQAIGGSTPTNTLSGYRAEDVNLDGVVRYVGTSNDRDLILQTIGGSIPTAVRIQQVPMW